MDDREILRHFQESPDPILFTGEVADLLGFSNKGAIMRLEKLEDSGMLDSKRAGRVPAWWLTDRGRAYLAGDLDASELDPED